MKTENLIEKPTVHPTSLRLSHDLSERLDKCAERLGLKRSLLTVKALEGLVSAAEQADYRLVLPIEFNIKTRAS